jgi:monoamine oxidase
MNRRDFSLLVKSLLAGTFLGSTRSNACATQKAQRVVVIGAGLAGLAAARKLKGLGHDVVVLEGRNRIGGRVHTSTQWSDLPLDLGASWIHGTTGNPLTALARQAGATLLTTRCGLHRI